jgi:hypothetical protein
MREMENIAKSMEGGALVGDAGKAFTDAIRSKLIKRMKVIETKMQEMEKDVKAAVSATRDGVKVAGARFND